MLRDRGFETVALTPGIDAEPIGEVAARLSGRPRVAVLAGAEGEGLGPETLALSAIRARIPMAEGVDSLNVTVAAAIALDRLRVAAKQD
jgi:tRNA G18 (ribose-2'-O)-methylase SpoU